MWSIAKEHEIEAREALLAKHRLSLEDNVWRALALLRSSRLISTQEAFGHLSMLSLGLDLGIIDDVKRELINSLFVTIQPSHLQHSEGKPLNDQQRDNVRAQVLRDALK